MAIDFNRSCIVGHRGAGNSAPGSTIAALQKAAELKLDWVEFDVRLTADKQLVIANSDDLTEFAGNPTKISTSTYQELAGLDVAKHFKGSCEPQKIPLFEDALRFCIQNDLRTQIELKGETGTEVELAQAVLTVLQQEEFTFPEGRHPLITSFSDECLTAVHDIAGKQFEMGLLIHTHLADQWKDMADKASPDFIHFYGGVDGNGERLTNKFSSAVQEAGYRLNAYKVNTVEDAQYALEAGAQRFTSDEPEKLLEIT